MLAYMENEDAIAAKINCGRTAEHLIHSLTRRLSKFTRGEASLSNVSPYPPLLLQGPFVSYEHRR